LKKQKDHLFLSFAFVTVVSLSFLAETIFFVNPLKLR